MSLPRGLGFDDAGQPVPVVMPVYHDDAPEPEAASGDRAEIVRRVCDFLEDGPPRQMAARLEALKMHFRLSGSTLREAAVLARTSRNSVHRAVRKVGQLFGGKSAESGTPTDR
jgi:hypothetical protein